MNKLITISAIASIFFISLSDLPAIPSGVKEYEKYAELTTHRQIHDEAKAEPEFELAIDIELARFEGRSLRPFVAIWVENENAESVRTLALWFNNYKWLPDLRKWFSKNYDKAQKFDYMDAVTGATRPAGKHTIIWNGKDDQGQLVQQGKYTVYIEVVRERGTYQLIRQPLELNDQPQRFDLPPGIEVSSATIEYRIVDKTSTALK